MTLVVDASVAVKWFVEEDGSDRALQLLESGEPIVAPDLVLAEMVNAAWKSLRRGELDPGQFDQMVSDTTVTFSRLVPLDGLVRRAAAIALELDHPVYDCFYLALAEAEGVPLITADRRLRGAAHGTPFAVRVTELGR